MPRKTKIEKGLPTEKISEKNQKPNSECPELSRFVTNASETGSDTPVSDPLPSDERTQGETPNPVLKRKKTPKNDPMRTRLVVQNEKAVLPSEIDASKRTRYWRPPVAESDWKPWWKPRKRPICGAKNPVVKKIRAQIEQELAMDEGELSRIPRDPNGRPIQSPELFTALVYWVARGGTLRAFCTAIDIPYGTVCHWIEKRPDVKEKYKEAEASSADALVEYAQELAVSPYMVEEVYTAYDAEGNVIRRDVKKQDAVYARKLAVGFCQWLASKRAPEKYGDKIEVKTDITMAGAIVAARRRLSGNVDGDDED